MEALEAAALAALDQDDLTPIAVWADHLISQGNPRGELIQLQLQQPSEANRRRQETLLAEQSEAILGEAYGMLARPVFQLGFLRSAELVYALDRRPGILRTLHSLHCRRGDRQHRDNQHALILSPLLHGLRRLTGAIELRTFIALATGEPRPLEHIDLPREVLAPSNRVTDALEQALQDMSGLPDVVSLRCLHVAPLPTWNHLLRAFPGVHTLEIRGTIPTLYPLLRLRPSVTVRLPSDNVAIALHDRVLTLESRLGRVYDDRRSVTLDGLALQLLERFASGTLGHVELHYPPVVQPDPGEQERLEQAIKRVCGPAST